ncbi:MAG TPA: hypothetical protein VE872_00740 [Candidatus Bathyarchaeia archaeon]|nr:hypothetical protein [Candidatus Bathyarchaeia archaeon]
MAGFIEHIRVGANGETEVLQRSAWSGPALSREQFTEIAFAILNDEGKGPKSGSETAPPAGNSPAPDAIRFVRDDGTEAYRYDVGDLAQDDQELPGTTKA